VIPDVAAGGHRHLAAGAAHDENLLVARAALQRLVGVDLERHLAPPRRPSSAVMTSFEFASLMRLASESG
jgi:hypothetical protein